MKRILLAPLFALTFALPASAEKLSLPAISAYINGLTKAQMSFTQINDDGSSSTGQLYLNRPGRMRFEYDAPSRDLVIAQGGVLNVFDGRSNTGPEKYQVAHTPLKLLLARNVDLTRAKMVTGHDGNDDFTVVTAQDPAEPEQGSIKLVFSNEPVSLRQWVITDNAGGRTTIDLGDVNEVTGFPYSTFFNASAEEKRRAK